MRPVHYRYFMIFLKSSSAAELPGRSVIGGGFETMIEVVMREGLFPQ